MSDFKSFAKAGHWPTLAASFLYFDFCFAIWVLNGAMAPFISESFNLSAAEKGFMISVPILAGALMRFPLGILAQYIGRKNAAMVEMSLIVAALAFGYAMVDTYDEVLAMGVLLGIAGAGNSGTVLAVLFAPPLAAKFGWQTVYGLAACTMILPMLVMWFAAKEPPDVEHQTFREHISCLFEADGWSFSLIYVVTFGGFIGLASFLPTYFYDQFKVTKIEAGQLTMLATVMGSGVRVVGGYISDRIGGINTLSGVLVLVAISLVACGFAGSSLAATTLLFMLCFAALGAGNGALFQLVPLRWPLTTAVAGSMIGEVGALGGGFIPNAMGLSKQHSGTYMWGFVAFAVLAVAMLVMLRIVQIRWTRTWAEKGGRARSTPTTVGTSGARRTA